MQIVNLLSGLSVLLTTLAYAHMVHHFTVEAGETGRNAIFWAGFTFALLVGIFSLIGGLLLLKRAR